MLTFIGIPLLAILVGALIAACYKLGGGKLQLVTGASWVFYGIYEHLMQIRLLCSGECNIRVDLLLIYPLLLVLTLVSAAHMVAALRRRAR